MTPKQIVPEEDADEVSEEEMLDSEEVSEEETLENSQDDVEARIAEYAAKLEQSQADLNALRSSLDRRNTETERAWQKKFEETQRQLHEARVAGMDDDQRREYEAKVFQEEYQTSQATVRDLEQRLSDREAELNAQMFFLREGVPMDALTLDQGIDALSNSGWAYLRNQRDELLAKIAEYEQGVAKPRKQAKKAPGVVTDKASPAKQGNTWKELIDKYGSEEEVWRRVEAGVINANVLPGMPD